MFMLTGMGLPDNLMSVHRKTEERVITITQFKIILINKTFSILILVMDSVITLQNIKQRRTVHKLYCQHRVSFCRCILHQFVKKS